MEGVAVARKIRVWEVSFAKRPKTGEKFILVKEDSMGNLERLVAQLAMQADVPPIVKEELKDLVGEPLKKEEVMELLGLEEKGDDPYKGIPEEIRKELQARDEAIRKLEFEQLRKEVEPIVGDGFKVVEKLWKEGVPRELIDEVVETVKVLKETVDKLGAPKGSGDDVGVSVEKELERIMKEKGLGRADALVELAKERPDLIGEWR